MLVTMKQIEVHKAVLKKREALKQEEKHLNKQREQFFVDSNIVGLKSIQTRLAKIDEELKYCDDLFSKFTKLSTFNIHELHLSLHELEWLHP